MYCTELAILGATQNSLHARALKCKRWTCEDCRETNKRRLIGIAIDGEPTTLLTLTTNPRYEANPELAAHALMDAWQRLIRKLKREYGKEHISYLCIWERTARGMPHLHVLLRAPYIPQYRISKEMRAMIDAPIVDIRKVKSARMIANYVAKYVTKDPARFPGHNRFSRAHTWRDTETARRNQWTPPEEIMWEVVHMNAGNLGKWLSRWLDVEVSADGNVLIASRRETNGGSP